MQAAFLWFLVSVVLLPALCAGDVQVCGASSNIYPAPGR